MIVDVHVIVIGPVIVDVSSNLHVILLICCDTQLPMGPADTCRMLSFQQLDVYRCSIELLALVHVLLGRIPRGHSDLVDQLRRATCSVPLNIAEGAGRTSRADKARHYAIARGSAMESAATLDVLQVLGLVNDGDYERGVELLDRVVSMLTRMIDP